MRYSRQAKKHNGDGRYGHPRKGRDMELYHMADVIPLLGIPEPPYGRSSYYVTCPCCDTDPRKKHLNINLQKDVFRCPRCGASGGIFDLYSICTGVPREKVRDILIEKLGKPSVRPARRQEAPVVHECPLTDVDTRHVTYMALLSKLTLAPDHLENLLARGLTEAEISRLGYKTTPILGSAAIAKQMQSDGLYLAGVPGFYRTESGAWTFAHEQRGILIPVRNLHGQIQGLQIRRDQVSRRKFRWVSSAEKPDGCRAEGWTHLAGPPAARIILTEGPMKADVIHTLTGMTVLAVPGVNALTQLQKALEVLREEGVKEIKTAFDMDMATNEHVQNGYRSLTELLSQMGFHFGTYLWDPQYKGLDDYIWESCLERHRPG